MKKLERFLGFKRSEKYKFGDVLLSLR